MKDKHRSIEGNQEVSRLLAAVRRLEIKSRRISHQHFIGDYSSAFRGSGLSFAEVRPYQYGDEVRNIDWNVTARTGQAYVKIFEEEREASLVLVFDNSASMFFGKDGAAKRDIALEICAIIVFSALAANDKVGLLLLQADDITFIPPGKGKNQLTHVLSTLVKAHQPKIGETRIGDALEYLLRRKVRAESCFVISDFQSKDFSDALKKTAIKYDLTGILIEDLAENKFPIDGLIQLSDLETGAPMLLNQLFSGNRERNENIGDRRFEKNKAIFQQSGSDLLRISTNEPYIPVLKAFFKRRVK
ncbi:MAG: DUF58 domain-containing protein [Saprospirales bacterium]|nr:MAG: DUF58 domain-containing protein [Saprospirales bacterium]